MREAEADWRRLAAITARGPWIGVANRLSVAHRDWPEIDAVQVATRRSAGAETPSQPSLEWPPLAARPDPVPASVLIRRRRSAVAFDGVTTLPAQAFHELLDATLPRAGVPPWSAWPARPCVHLVVFVHRVDGVAPGLYALLRDPAAFDEVSRAIAPDAPWVRCGPSHLPLYRLAEADVREVAQHIACHQDIAADSCFSLGMVASMSAVAREPALYRDRFRESGLIGQALYLEAEAAGVRATGIGCFFDDAMHRLLGLEGNAWQSLYHFTVGGPVEDARLMTLPPYPPRRG